MKLELKTESFEKTPCMVKYKERKFLMQVINTVQFIIILLMLGLLMFMFEEKETNVSYQTVIKTSLDWVRILLDLLGIFLILLLAWLTKNPLLAWLTPSDGVDRYAWGKESLLREGGDGPTWYFGPAKRE